jgi:DNA mismatch repair protein MutS
LLSDLLLKHFGTAVAKGFWGGGPGCGHHCRRERLCIICAETRHDQLGHINKISRIDEQQYVWLDKFTIRNLEINHTLNEQGSTLIGVH